VTDEHDRRTQNARGQQYALSTLKLGYEGVVKNVAPVRPFEKRLDHVTARHQAHETGDGDLQWAETIPLQGEDQEDRAEPPGREGAGPPEFLRGKELCHQVIVPNAPVTPSRSRRTSRSAFMALAISRISV
jgi:hypothetical protein